MKTLTVCGLLTVLLLTPLGALHAQQREAQPKGEPSNAKEAATKKTAVDQATDDKYQQWKATCSAAEQAWLSVLEANLGNFYLPIYKLDKVRGNITAWDYVKDDPQLPRVLLIGDSISRGYTLAVRQALAGKANVHRAPENCGRSANGLKKLPVYLGEGKWDVIHFNFGIHDRTTDGKVYADNLEKIVAQLAQTGAKLIWARTTPVVSARNNEKFSPEQCATVNRIADGIMQKHGIPIDDLCTLVQPRLAELQLPDNVHFKETGYNVLGGQVAAEILAVLGKAKVSAAAPKTAIAVPVEKDKRLHANGQAWRFDQAAVSDPARPRVLVVGDSILNGYLPRVLNLLSGKVYVDAWVNPHFQSANYTKLLAQVLDSGPYDVVHINVGLHGWAKGRIPDGQFEPLTKDFVTVIQQKCPQAKIIWASSTPVTVKGKPTELDPAINPIIIEHNRMAAKVMGEMKVSVNDFYGVLVSKLNLSGGDQFHWKAPAYKILADAAVKEIVAALPAK